MSTTELTHRLTPQTRLALLPQLRHWILWPAILASALVVLGLTLTSVRALTVADLSVDQAASRSHTGVLTIIALALNSLFTPVGGMTLLAGVCLVLLILRRSPVNAAAVAGVTLAGWLSSETLKSIVARHRPDGALLAHPLVTERGFDSFPSGHTCLAVSLSIALYLLARGTRAQWFVLAGGVGLSVMVAASRVYLGAHYPTDVAASFLVSLAGILFFCGLWNRYALRILGKIGVLRRFGPVPVVDIPQGR